MQKLNLVQQYKEYFSAKKDPEIVHIEPAQFIAIEGLGDPSGEPFSRRIEALYATAYTVKFSCKEKGQDFVVSKLEGLWWFDESKYPDSTMDSAPAKIPRSEWAYRLLIRMPDFVTEGVIEEACRHVAERKNIAMAQSVGHFILSEGQCVQMLHTGPFSTEPLSLARMNSFMQQRGLAKNGCHHEIYLSDFRKTAPDKLKTILREPVK